MEEVKTLDNTFDELNSKHRKERKELQSTIQSLKKSAAKGDKKKRKEILEEISRLEIDLEQKQTEELNEFQNDKNNEHSGEDITNNSLETSNLSTSDTDNQPRVSKAQRRRNKKALEEKQREEEILAHEEENENGPRVTETRAIEEILKKRNLCLYPISSDGDCLYNAIQHQLNLTGRELLTVAQLRQKTAKYILENKSDLIFYMTDTNTGEFLTDEGFSTYCQNIQNTPAWGGQIEIKALSSALHVPIEVLQANGPPTIQGVEYSGPNLVVTYHRVMYSLGEHYNSTKPLETSQESETNETTPTMEC